MLELVNDRSWIDNIGERNVRTLEDARRYIEDSAIAMYERLGFGLYAVELEKTGEPTGICGLVKREGLDDVDLGFAFLPRFWGLGYALEASRAVLSYATETLGRRRIVDPVRNRLAGDVVLHGLQRSYPAANSVCPS